MLLPKFTQELTICLFSGIEGSEARFYSFIVILN
jgi:hypothetical protein